MILPFYPAINKYFFQLHENSYVCARKSFDLFRVVIFLAFFSLFGFILTTALVAWNAPMQWNIRLPVFLGLGISLLLVLRGNCYVANIVALVYWPFALYLASDYIPVPFLFIIMAIAMSLSAMMAVHKLIHYVVSFGFVAVFLFVLRSGQGVQEVPMYQVLSEKPELLPFVISIPFVFLVSTSIQLSQRHQAILSDYEKEKKADQLIKANQYKSEFLAKMSHEIRTPMNSIIGLSDLAAAEEDLDRVHSYLQTVRSSSEHLMRVIDDILDLSKIEAGEMKIVHRDFSFTRFLNEIVDVFRPIAEKKDIQFIDELHKDLCETVYSDEIRLRQVIYNLLSNAIKFTEAGSVSLAVYPVGKEKTVTVDGESCTARFVHFEVRDTGPGVDEEFEEELFHEFKQSGRVMDRRYKGTGLGLSISRQIVEKMDGRIVHENLEQGGSRFYFEVPLTKKNIRLDTDKKIEERKNNNSVRNYQILLAEDDEDNQILFSVYMKKLGYEFEIVNNGEEALNVLQSKRFDFVFMDFEMPVLGGLDAARGIRAGKAGEEAKEIYITGLTAFAQSEMREKGLDAGMNNYLTKPFTLEQLRNKIAEIGNLID